MRSRSATLLANRGPLRMCTPDDLGKPHATLLPSLQFDLAASLTQYCVVSSESNTAIISLKSTKMDAGDFGPTPWGIPIELQRSPGTPSSPGRRGPQTSGAPQRAVAAARAAAAAAPRESRRRGWPGTRAERSHAAERHVEDQMHCTAQEKATGNTGIRVRANHLRSSRRRARWHGRAHCFATFKK